MSDVKAIRLFFEELAFNVVSSRYPVELADAAELAAVQLRLDFPSGDATKQNIACAWVDCCGGLWRLCGRVFCCFFVVFLRLIFCAPPPTISNPPCKDGARLCAAAAPEGACEGVAAACARGVCAPGAAAL